MGMPDHPVSGDEIYARFFHGPAFQVLNRVTGSRRMGCWPKAQFGTWELRAGWPPPGWSSRPPFWRRDCTA